jgi:penicillin-binding protein 1C
MIQRKTLSIRALLASFRFYRKSLLKILLFAGILFVFIWYLFSLPDPLFSDPYCTVITDRNEKLLGAKISEDGQFRFPPADEVPHKLKQCIINFEDKRFYLHSGFDPIAILRALKQNLAAREIVSGASTLSMQVVRLARKNTDRNIWEKITEIFRASRLEQSYSKDEILTLYMSHAPFGGNVVGMEAAAWRWFGVSPEKLTWAQSAVLAVLPNSPGLIHPGRNRDQLTEKRNRLLKDLLTEGIIDSSTFALSLTEPVPEAPKAFPFDAYHVLIKASAEMNDNALIQTTIDRSLQKKINEIVYRNHKRLSQNGVMNLAVLVLDTESGEVLAYTGNVPFYGNTKENYDFHVDMIPALRSTGSVLKPFLFASMLSSGDILENAFVLDIPTKMGGFTPENFNRTYDGVVPASQALARSLNIPASRMLRQYGLHRFYSQLEKTGLTSLSEHPSYYGLSLVLGGCEASLWELAGMYASTARSLLHFEENGNAYQSSDYRPPVLFSEQASKLKGLKDNAVTEKHSVYDASSLWITLKAMLEVDRPQGELHDNYLFSTEKIAWKTGTSFGFRDAWSIGLTPKYTVGVWAGNADGEGKPNLIGITAAAPVLFQVFDALPDSEHWFSYPDDDFIEIKVCRQSGFLAGINCPEPVSVFAGKHAERFAACPYHKIVHLDAQGQYRVHADCYPVHDMKTEKRLILPPAAEMYYKRKHPSYRGMPPYRDDCKAGTYFESDNIELIYPHNYSQIYIPVEIDGRPGKVVFEAVHRKEDARLFWYIDNDYIGETRFYHIQELRPDKGMHKLTIVDEKGEKITRDFEILSKNRKSEQNQ